MKILSVVGARPQFVKAGPVSRAIRAAGMDEVLVHTGQHYDAGLSKVFFDELGLPAPTHHLGVGSAAHGAQTGAMLAALEPVMAAERPDWTLVYGDTNSTLAGALCAAKMGVRLAHVEAGLRSFNRRMPEEVNRVVTDRLSDLNFCPTDTAVGNLAAEGLSAGVILTGDVMLDAVRLFLLAGAPAESAWRAEGRWPSGPFCLATCHRPENTDQPARLAGILMALERLGRRQPVLLPLHPRTRQALARQGLTPGPHIQVLEPLGYPLMLRLVQAAALLLTDSGGMQKEAYILGTPCLTMRDETEWPETLAHGWNRLTGADEAAIVASAAVAMSESRPPSRAEEVYGGGQAAARVAAALAERG